VTSGNSVYENTVSGIYTANGSTIAQGCIATIPEPSAIALLAAAGAMLWFRARRRD
jgi:hypothetical protein